MNSNDMKIKKAENILLISTIIFVINVIGLVCGGMILIVNSFKEKAFDWQMFVYGMVCFVGIIFAWAFKQILDGYALIVYNAAVELHDKNVQTSIDVE